MATFSVSCAPSATFSAGASQYEEGCGIAYQGQTASTITAVSNINACAAACTSGCMAVNYASSSCTLVTDPSTAIPARGTDAFAAYNLALGYNPTGTAVSATTVDPTTSPNSLTTSSGITTTSSASSTPSSSPSTSTSSNSSGLSGGAVAGVAIGCAIGGALIAFLATFFLCRRKRPQNGGTAFLSDEKPNFAQPWDAFLPQSADDHKLTTAVQALYTQIDQHVENYYQNSANQQELLSGRSNIAQYDSGKLPGSLDALLKEGSVSLPFIKHATAWYILSRLSPSASGDTLLPQEFGRMPPKLENVKSRTGEGKAASEAYSYWKVLTTYLMYPKGTGSNINRAVVVEGAGGLSTAFAAWSKDVRGAHEHLQKIMTASADTGLLVVSQPSRFDFNWDLSKEASRTSIVVFPEFHKTANEKGNVLTPPQRLVKPTLEKLRT